MSKREAQLSRGKEPKPCDARDKCKEVLRLEWRTNRADRSATVVCLASGIIIMSWEADAGNSVSWLGVNLDIKKSPRDRALDSAQQDRCSLP
ncbi:hypothetical protein H112_08815 [Trichophyton rubrum D6]|uniref:Uncharacterized protein n=2 Tax=Trichophyton TaxID=5550 RepID=A0A022VMW4_TRIRU|nr:hypothetical protein H100_08836 [Trichophyton rubrum MR850]EZF36646.1 hypothetical protein H102_08797 [Trichophyton rubrum CBS 100081]EZF47336.1 hypothetical protein H103_08819 [Trichophyton rubrum CBS 288.86]EZF57976.1 hypothetical protein H104_08767 [Trichophyton rubrum CBS 289.86]EZF68624.1 hypothetical protein H105_08822 [Trichophyton soudanense CBS 452.61]EZF79194.1 hypothetical protein H110_08820 [Trichophyton rubrum MR1448]EZF90270.1 hypothetical protein H113_08887 [Trichophyton rub